MELKNKNKPMELNEVIPSNNNLVQAKNEQQEQKLLNEILDYSKQISEIENPEIIDLIKIDNDVVCYKNSITTLAGAFGSHKSRLIDSIIAGTLNPESEFNYSNISISEPLQVLLIDTELDKNEFALKLKRLNNKFDNDKHFHYASLLQIKRLNRLLALKLLIEKCLQENERPLLCIIDVTTDMLMNFNDLTETFNLIDYVLTLKNDYNVTFIVVMHLNPAPQGTFTKTRGHLGTELSNKSAIELHISVDKDGVINLKCNKIRHHLKWEKQFEYCEGLLKVLSNESMELLKAKQQTEMNINVLNFVETSPKSHNDLMTFLKQNYQYGKPRAEQYIKSIIDKELNNNKYFRMTQHGNRQPKTYQIELLE